MNEAEFRALVTALDRTAKWPEDPGRGALNFLTAQATLSGLGTVTEGVVISCADNEAARNVLTPGSAGAPLTTSVDTAHDWLAVNEDVRYSQHGPAAMTHLDSLGHFFYRNRGYGGTTPAVVSDNGVTANDVVPAAGGIVGRGVLLDLPRVINQRYVPAHRLVTLIEILQWLTATNTSPQPGDILYIRTGRPHSPTPPPGSFFEVGTLDLDCAQWMFDMEFAVVLSDAGLDSPHEIVENVSAPWHVLTLIAMGLFLVDSANLENLAVACEKYGRNVFCAVLAALPLPGATASPVNPLALL